MLEVRNISFRVKKVNLLNRINFEAAPNELICIVGPNGSGKSTLLNIISSFLFPTEGEVVWHGNSLHKQSKKNLSKQRAVLTQSIIISSGFKCSEVVMMGRYPHFKHQPTNEDYNIVHNSMKDTHTEQYKDRSFHTLSGGEAQRVQIARVFSQLGGTGKLLLLDEPLNNLDIKYQLSILKWVKSFAQKGNLVLMVIHDINLAAAYADKILLLKNGEVTKYGRPENVIREQVLFDCFECPVHVSKHPFKKALTVFFDGQTDEVLL